MRWIFVDAVYYIALLDRRDRFYAQAAAFDTTASNLRFVTTDAVLAEVLAFVSGRGPRARAAALALIDALFARANVTVIRQTPDLFDEALALYRLRPDKAYSLVDCMSMVVCRQMEIAEVLTHDRHFQQEGFTVLL